MQGLKTQLLTWLIPNYCYLCLAPSHQHLCAGCESDLPHIDLGCRYCDIPLVHARAHARDSVICGECQKTIPSFSQIISGFEYAHSIPHLIKQFKHRSQKQCGAFLSKHLAERVCSRHAQKPNHTIDMLVPVPLHWRRQLARGFNQADFIAQRLSKHLGIPRLHAVKRHHATPQQQQLKRKERLSNLKSAFCITRPVKGKQIALIDDVVTTTATVETISALLMQHGASHVEVWCLARTAKPMEKAPKL